MFIASFQTVLMSSLPFLCYVTNLLRFAVEMTLTSMLLVPGRNQLALFYIVLDEFPFTSRSEDRPVHGIVFKRPQIWSASRQSG
jgi:hypothetical protein